MVVDGLLYTKEHEWVKVEGGIATIGISDHAQEQLGEITFVELPAVGQEFAKQGELAIAESSKAASDIYSPISGKVTEINTELEAAPEKVNEDCYNSGWFCKMQITDPSSTKDLMDAKQYEEYLKGI